jgi:hypothetical protein
MLTGALGCWIAAIITAGGAWMFLFLALGAVLMLSGLALSRPRPARARAWEMQSEQVAS